MKAITKTVTVYVADDGVEFDYPADCLAAEMTSIQVRFRKELERDPVKDFNVLARLIVLEPTVLDKLEELALLYGMEPRKD